MYAQLKITYTLMDNENNRATLDVNVYIPAKLLHPVQTHNPVYCTYIIRYTVSVEVNT